MGALNHILSINGAALDYDPSRTVIVSEELKPTERVEEGLIS